MTPPKPQADYERDILDKIEKHGWFCTAVFDPDGLQPSFAYSVGFTTTLQQPEFIVFGLKSELMHAMLWNVFRAIKAGETPADDKRWAGILGGFDCVSRRVHPTNIVRDYLNSAMWYWGDRPEPLPAYQLVWPGAVDGRFPWDPDCSEIVRALQPALYLPNAELH